MASEFGKVLGLKKQTKLHKWRQREHEVQQLRGKPLRRSRPELEHGTAGASYTAQSTMASAADSTATSASTTTRITNPEEATANPHSSGELASTTMANGENTPATLLEFMTGLGASSGSEEMKDFMAFDYRERRTNYMHGCIMVDEVLLETMYGCYLEKLVMQSKRNFESTTLQIFQYLRYHGWCMLNMNGITVNIV